MCPASTETIQCRTHSEQLLGQVPPLVDAPIHGDETVHPRFVSHVGIVEARVQHDDGKGQHVTRVCKQGDAPHWLLLFILYKLSKLQ